MVAALRREGVVEDPLVFEWYGRYREVGRRIKAGTYAVDLSITPRELLGRLEAGTLPAQVRITIPEGYNRWQVADLLAKQGLVDRAEFLRRVERDGLEGRLFPDTYWVRKDAGLDAVIDLLTRRFDEVWEQLLKEQPGAKVDRGRTINLASLVEKEARTERDRPLVARVFLNRLEKKMRLQTDPTCVYGPELYEETPHPRFCKDPSSRYSTYVIDGLPPTPIANPGRAALRAVLAPARGPGADELLYFVARRDGSGEHHFSATYEEHRKAVQRYLVDKR